MDISDIVALAKAGFNVEQIAKLASAPAPAHASAPAHAPAPVTAPAPDADNNVAQKLDFLTQLLQNSNIINSNQPKVETVDDIIANIISPNRTVKEE